MQYLRHLNPKPATLAVRTCSATVRVSLLLMHGLDLAEAVSSLAQSYEQVNIILSKHRIRAYLCEPCATAGHFLSL
jgi:hypothetical protein